MPPCAPARRCRPCARPCSRPRRVGARVRASKRARPEPARRRRARLDHAGAPPPGASSATTRRTPPLLLAPARRRATRARSPSGSGRALGERLGGSARAVRGGRARLPEPVPLRRVADGGARRRCSPPASASARAAPPARERMLVEFVSANPTGPDARRPRAQRGLRRCARRACSPATATSVEREFYVNDAGSQVRKLGESIARARAWRDGRRRTATGASTCGELVDARPGPIGRPDRRSGGAAVARDGRGAWSARLRSFSVEGFDHWAYESALHEGDPSAVDHTLAILEQQGRTYTQRGCAVAAHERVRRRQGSRAGPLERRAHLLRLGHRLPPGQARARLRAPDRRVGRRPPRLRAADEGRL